MLGPHLRFDQVTCIAITGGDLGPTLNGQPVRNYQAIQVEAGQVLRFTAPKTGCRAYVDDALAIRAAFPDVEDTEVPAGFAESVMSAVRAAAQEKPAAPQAKQRHWGRVLLPLYRATGK